MTLSCDLVVRRRLGPMMSECEHDGEEQRVKTHRHWSRTAAVTVSELDC